ncbi:hypothetical protein SAMN04489760_103155 [Syntrophus gentianae]|uniref:Uncharacterized protein n=1 Tax=Syntrophus gentianae TaxID=43775 RepID=A0A1H7VCX3_9BACT|nr:hypothetical protein [Syntrophus gentianae]SEM06627.1 hypothetical protein SAMN04489760_103155 [Syntrophus gentianae]
MAMSHEDRIIAAMQMIQVTPDNYKDVSADMITHLFRVVLEAEVMLKSETPYEGLSEQEIEDRKMKLE